MKKEKTKRYKKKFCYSADQEEYTFRLKRRNWKWLWLLLLLPLLLLFVKCERDIHVQTLDAVTNEPIPDVEVEIDYTAHYLLNHGRFFVSTPVGRTLTTDENGQGTFKKLPCSVFSYLFYALGKAHFDAGTDCHTLERTETSFFHFVRNKRLWLDPKKTNLTLSVVDGETMDALAEAVLVYDVPFGNQTDSILTSVTGDCVIKGLPLCGSLLLNRVSCYGYADTSDVEIDVLAARKSPDLACIKLRPLKQSFSYTVKNKFTKEPIPGATVYVTLTSNRGKTLRGKSVTNVDGRGLGVYKDAFILANLELKATKKHYKDGYFEKECTVEEFAKLPQEERVIYLEPEPYMVQFQNVDSITGVPIKGVSNEIHIHSISGQDEELTEYSNSHGIFEIKAMEGDRIQIISECSPYYYRKETLIPSFDQGEIIRMQPQKTDLTFRTLDASTQEILPQCDLKVTSTISKTSIPVSSGDGVFVVKNVYVTEKISIEASKNDYLPNTTKIRQAEVAQLMNAPQERRDIPLSPDIAPCDASGKGESMVTAGTVSSPQSYNMGTNYGTFEITYDTGNSCTDCIDIYNHKPGDDPLSGVRVFSSGQVATDGNRTTVVSFSNGSVITVIVTTGPSDGSMWEYHISCPY